MSRKIYIANQDLSLAEYCPAIDDSDYYACWQDPDTQNGYTLGIVSLSPGEFTARPGNYAVQALQGGRDTGQAPSLLLQSIALKPFILNACMQDAMKPTRPA